MVAPALTAAGQAFTHTPSYWKTLDPKAAALLVEFGAGDTRALEVLQNKVIEIDRHSQSDQSSRVHERAEAVELAWHVREGLLGLVGKLRPKGSTLITEDVCFPPERLAQGAGRPGNCSAARLHPRNRRPRSPWKSHFTLVADFGDPEGHKRYAAFMEELVDLVVRKHDGSLKAEHGTRLNMGAFPRVGMGREGHRHDVAAQRLADPKGILGPNVILTRNAKLHLENLKSVPQIENVTDSSQCNRVRILRTGLSQAVR